MVELRNATPHDINMYDTETNEPTITIAAGDLIFRANSPYSREMPSLNIGGDEIPVYELTSAPGCHAIKVEYVAAPGVKTFSERVETTVDVPEVEEGVFWIVSKICYDAMGGRSDLLMVNHTVRGPDNRIIGCYSLARSDS